MSKETILSKIMEFCHENGEDPFEYQSDAAPTEPVFVSWCYGKGYITSERFEYFLNNHKEYEFFQLFGDSADHDPIVLSEHWGYDYLAEFIASSKFYTERFEKNFEL